MDKENLRKIVPLFWLVIFGVMSVILKDILPFFLAVVFSGGWYLCYYYSNKYREVKQ